jgi:hypothetical protein
MSIWIDRKFTLLLSPKLENFKQKNSNLFTFRCPYCGDSQKIKSKTRGFIYEKSNNYFFTCFNCEKGTTLKSLIQFLDPYLEKEYVLENFKEKSSNFIPPKPEFKPSIPKFKTVESRLNLPTIASLPDTNVAKKYILDRKIPTFAHNLLYYAEDFKEFVSSVSDKELEKTGPRIVIPFFSKDGTLIAFQGRALDSYSMRYITVTVDKNHAKIFGIERINPKQQILVVEGPLDSLFLPNSIATADSNLASAVSVFDKTKLVLVSDNEPRNKNIVNNIEKYIKNGFNVCLFPDYIKEKDINDMLLNGLTKEDILGIINENTFRGLRAQIEFINWKKL